MTRPEYDDLFEQLCYGHEAELTYNGKQYFLEWEDSKIVVYLETENKTVIIERITGIDRISVVRRLFRSPIWDHHSLDKTFHSIEIVDIE